jgi:hypothetical protein
VDLNFAMTFSCGMLHVWPQHIQVDSMLRACFHDPVRIAFARNKQMLGNPISRNIKLNKSKMVDTQFGETTITCNNVLSMSATISFLKSNCFRM